MSIPIVKHLIGHLRKRNERRSGVAITGAEWVSRDATKITDVELCETFVAGKERRGS